MKQTARRAIITLTAGTLALSGLAVANPATAAPPSTDVDPTATVRPDNIPGPLTAEMEARRKLAQPHILANAGNANKNARGGRTDVVEVADGKFYQVTRTGTDQIFTILAEFGDETDPGLGDDPGPLHNAIPEPDRSVDNSTYWQADFSQQSYHDLFFGEGESLANFYTAQSSGNYTVAGEVSDWVQVPGNASRYGDNEVEGAGGASRFIGDSANAWYDSRVAAGASRDEIVAELASFDQWDRYDQDGDGDFNEPDGYIDHFQAVHSGEGEEAGGGVQGEDAIWSHRSYAGPAGFGTEGPDGYALQGGVQIGDSGVWIGDYTVEPENGGLGVFAHEFAHDLGLPDFYDTAGGDNGTAFWTLMSGGSWLGHGGDAIGTTPNFMGPWEKLQLGWLDYSVVSTGTDATEYTLNPAAVQADGTDQALIVDVPDSPVTLELMDLDGGHAWWTGSADGLNTTLTRQVDLSTGKSKGADATLSFRAAYEIEQDYDNLYVEYRTATKTKPGKGSSNGKGKQEVWSDWTSAGPVITGDSAGEWEDFSYTLPGGKKTEFRFRYATDMGVHLNGALIDDISVTAGRKTLLKDDVEKGDRGWTAADGFTISDGTYEVMGEQYYLLENRTYTSYDATLQTGPYQFSNGYTQPTRVEHFPFQDGLLVWSINEGFTDNNTSRHAGYGLALPVDARPAPFTYDGGGQPGNRRQTYDATFGLQLIDPVTLHSERVVDDAVVTLTAVGSTGTEQQSSTFSDAVTDAYFSADNPWAGVYVSGHGVSATVTAQEDGGNLTVEVTNPAE